MDLHVHRRSADSDVVRCGVIEICETCGCIQWLHIILYVEIVTYEQ